MRVCAGDVLNCHFPLHAGGGGQAKLPRDPADRLAEGFKQSECRAGTKPGFGEIEEVLWIVSNELRCPSSVLSPFPPSKPDGTGERVDKAVVKPAARTYGRVPEERLGCTVVRKQDEFQAACPCVIRVMRPEK